MTGWLIELMDIYIANVPYDERNGSKVRPALIIEVGRECVMVFKITSQYQHKSAQIKQLYYSIQNWQETDLKKQSCV